jgi:hypothetical protein
MVCCTFADSRILRHLSKTFSELRAKTLLKFEARVYNSTPAAASTPRVLPFTSTSDADRIAFVTSVI